MNNLVIALNSVRPLTWLMIFILFIGPKLLRMWKPDPVAPLLARLDDYLNNLHSNVWAMSLLAGGFFLVLYGKNDPGLIVLGTRLLTLKTDTNGNGNGKTT